MPAAKPEGLFPGPDEGIGDLLRDRRFYTDGAVPPVLFVTANAVWGLNVAAIAAASFAVALTAWRLVRRERVIHAIGGLLGLGIALLIALRTGSASNYFLPGVISGSVMTVVGVGSIIVARPISATLFRAVEQRPREWYRIPRVRNTHLIITAAWTLLIGGRTGLRGWLILQDRTIELAAQSVLLGVPLTLGLVGASWVFLRRRLADVPVPDPEPAAEAVVPPSDQLG
jgi:hypothetical protein